MYELLDLLQDSLDRRAPRREGKLIEDPEAPYHWLVEHWYIDCDSPELSFPYYSYIPFPCSERRARFIAWELGFDTTERRPA